MFFEYGNEYVDHLLPLIMKSIVKNEKYADHSHGCINFIYICIEFYCYDIGMYIKEFNTTVSYINSEKHVRVRQSDTQLSDKNSWNRMSLTT